MILNLILALKMYTINPYFVIQMCCSMKKTVIWYDFINAGIVQVKDIRYEVVESFFFLPEMAPS